MWSVGSNGQTCFEEEWHALAPLCKVHVFDPTLSARARDKLGRLQRNGMLRLHSIGLSSKAGKGILQAGLTRRAESLTLLQMMRHTNTTWIDYLKTDCEGCEFAAVAQFLDEMRLMRAEGRTVPVTQLQMEVHVPGRSLAHTRAWAANGINHTNPIWPRYARTNRRALDMLSKLLSFGFVVFHIELGGAHPFKCCGAEVTLVNTRAFNRLQSEGPFEDFVGPESSLEAQSLQADDDSSC